MRYNSTKYLLLDTETTGLDPDKNALIEVGAQLLTPSLDQVDVEPFHTYVRPGKDDKIDHRALAVNKQTWVNEPESDIYRNKAVTAEQMFKGLNDWLNRYGGASWVVPVGWNVGFDYDFFKATFRKVHGDEPQTGRDPWPFHYHKIDLLGVCRFMDARMGRSRRSYKLEDMARQYYGSISEFAMHTALGDADMCIKVAHAVEAERLEHWAEQHETTLSELRDAEAAFMVAGGRGVELADRIDELRAELYSEEMSEEDTNVEEGSESAAEDPSGTSPR